MGFVPREIYEGSDGVATRNFYEEMNSKSIHGELATALFRAQKRSSSAKKYRGRRYTEAAYSVKNWSLGEICRILTLIDKHTFDPPTPYTWGWKLDPDTPGYQWVLYVDLPQGQVSFHSLDRLKGPDYLGDWDGKRLSEERIIAFCDSIIGTTTEPSS